MFLGFTASEKHNMLTSMLIHLVLYVVIFNTLLKVVFFVVGPEFLRAVRRMNSLYVKYTMYKIFKRVPSVHWTHCRFNI